jgi:HK97 family phage major capsid protein
LGKGSRRGTAARAKDFAMTVHVKMADLLKKRAAAVKTLEDIGLKDDFKPETDGPAYEAAKEVIKGVDAEITRFTEMQEIAAKSAQPSAGQDAPTVSATVEGDRYVKEKSLIIGGMVKMFAAGGGSIHNARLEAKELYGDNHPVTKALIVSSGSAGGFIVPPDQMTEIIELLRPKAQVRAAGPRNIPMPRGTMTLPGQASGASAGYGSEVKKIASSQPGLNQIVASYKKLTALVPVGNDMMRYANPAVDAFVRDDLIKVIALREDLAFILGDGTADSPRGYISFANSYAAQQGGTAGTWSSTGNSTMGTGGNFITSTSSFTLATVATELGGAINKLDQANVPDDKRVWFMNPRAKNYLYNVQNSLGVYVYRDEISKGTLLGYPFRLTTQIPVNIHNGDSSQTDCSFVFLAEMTETMILDSMQMQMAVSQEGTYVDGNGVSISAFQNDQTLIRAIEEHDFQLRHDAAVAVIQGVRWAPAIS